MKKPKEQQQRRVVNYEDFNLKKFKLSNNGEVKSILDYSIFNSDIDETNEKSKTQPSEDLVKAVESLAEYMADASGALITIDAQVSQAKTNKDLESTEGLLELRNEIISMYKPSGYSVSGEGGKRAVKITGSCSAPRRGSYAFATPRILLEIDKLGYEEELSENIEKIRKEVYLMRFNGKRGKLPEDNQTRIDDEDQQGD